MEFTRGKLVALGLLVALLIGVSWYAWNVLTTSPAEQLATSPAGTALTQSTYTDLDGTPVDLSQYLGSVTVVAAWASWCPPCREQLRELSALGDSYGESVTIVGVNRAEPKTTAERYLAQVDTSDSINLILDPDDVYYESIGGYAMPETIVYGADGNIVYHGRGSIEPDRVRAAIEEATRTTE